MEKVDWKVEGMTCSNCALTISSFLRKEGMQEIKVNPIAGDVSFTIASENVAADKLRSGIERLGYKVVTNGTANKATKRSFLSDNKSRFLFCLPFTLVLLLHMV